MEIIQKKQKNRKRKNLFLKKSGITKIRKTISVIEVMTISMIVAKTISVIVAKTKSVIVAKTISVIAVKTIRGIEVDEGAEVLTKVGIVIVVAVVAGRVTGDERMEIVG